jgi:hypothetical protein
MVDVQSEIEKLLARCKAAYPGKSITVLAHPTRPHGSYNKSAVVLADKTPCAKYFVRFPLRADKKSRTLELHIECSNEVSEING